MIGIAGDSRTSSVPGLNASPRTVTGRPAQLARNVLDEPHHLVRLRFVRLDHGTQNAHRLASTIPSLISARTSFGRQLPPKPQPAPRNEAIGARMRSPCDEGREVVREMDARA